jgi:DNA-binding response OmpR family regulator
MMAARMPQAAGASGAIVDFHGVKVDLVTRAILNRSGRPGPELTETELSLLRLLTENMDRVVAKESLFSAIYARPYAPGTRSLDVGVSRLRIKLRSTDVGAEIRSVREAGYMFSLERDSVASARAG